jgi:hypothetical protein
MAGMAEDGGESGVAFLASAELLYYRYRALMRSVIFVLLPVAAASVGCAATGGDVGDAETATTTSALVVVERTSDGAQASARFVRASASASPAAAMRSVGAGLDLPSPGACAPLAVLASAVSSDPAPVVELLDVGPVTLEANGVATRLLPRQLPDVTDVVSGVVYARAADSTLLPASAPYLLHVAGGTGLGSLDVAALSPADPASIRVLVDGSGAEDTSVEDASVGANGKKPTAIVSVVSGAAVTIEWSDEGAGDEVYVDVRPSNVRCLLDGAGHGTLPSAFFDDAGTLLLHRLHRELLRAKGIDSGEIRFDFARSIAYVRH